MASKQVRQTMEKKLLHVGNSLALIIPKALRDILGFDYATLLEISIIRHPARKVLGLSVFPAEGERQKAEDRKQKAEDREQKAKDELPTSDFCPLTSDF